MSTVVDLRGRVEPFSDNRRRSGGDFDGRAHIVLIAKLQPLGIQGGRHSVLYMLYSKEYI